MDITAILIVIGFLILLALGPPVAAAMGFVAFVGMILGPGLEKGIVASSTEVYYFLTSYALVPLPLFALMGNLFAASGVSTDIFDMARAWLSRIRGGLAMVGIGTCTAFGTLSGSSISATATLGPVIIPEMQRAGYDQKLTVGTIGAAGGLAHLIPPSAIAVFYAALVEVSAGKQLFAGLIPGLILAVCFAGVVFIWASISPKLAPLGERVSWKVRFFSLRKVIAPAIVALVVLIAIYTGMATVTEAAAVGAFAGLVLCLFKRVKLAVYRSALMDTVTAIGFILLISAAAKMFSWTLSYYMLPQQLAEFLTNAHMSPIVTLIAIQILYLILGCFIDTISMLLLTVPVLFPLMTAMGYDLIWFGVLFMINVEMALITPPFGFHLFIIKGIAPKVPMSDIIKGCLVFAIADVFVLGLVMAFPGLALWLPNLMSHS
jgi:C4-dicarboxylate transporter, DctM subunit